MLRSPLPGLARKSSLLLRLWLMLVLALFGRELHAAPEAHILRIDPRASQGDGNPVLTTLIEVVQNERVSTAIAPCATMTGNAQFSCMSDALEKPYALYKPFPFPENHAIFTVLVDGSERPAKFLSQSKWSDSLNQPGVGTAWLILIDADRRMGKSFEDAQKVARAFVSSMGPNDIANIMYFNDRQVVRDSQWMPASAKGKALSFLDQVSTTYPNQGRTRSLLSIIKQAATDGFKALGNVGEGVAVPMHQAMVVLSNGYGGADAATSGPGAIQLQGYMTGGRFPEDNTAMPKAPVPVISVLFPYRTVDEFRQNALEFMQNLANPEIGGFFTVVQEGQGDRGSAVVNAVKSRFGKMYIVKWKVSCLAPTVTQTFRLFFTDVKPQIVGDNTFKDVPIGVDPSAWPLDVNVDYTQQMVSRQGGVYPGGTFKVFGDFCWGGDVTRAEVYMLPAGQALPKELTGGSVEDAKRAQQQLIAMGMKGGTIAASDAFAEFEAPDKDNVLHGSGAQAMVRLVIYDNKAMRASGVTADSVLQLRGTARPFPLLYVLAGAFAAVVILLLIVVIARSGKGKRPAGPPGYGPPPQGGGPFVPPVGYSGPQGGGYGAPPAPGYGPPPQGYGGPPPPARGASPAAVPGDSSSENQVRAVLWGAPGVFAVTPGATVKAGSDHKACQITLHAEEAAPVQAELVLESGQLLVRSDERQFHTHVNGYPVAQSWTPVAQGSLLRLGRAEFSVELH